MPDFGTIVRALDGSQEGDSYRCRCPVHGGRSLSMTQKGGRILVFCFAGCDSRDVLHALRERGLWTGRGEKLSIPTGPLGRAGTLQRLEAAERMWHEARPIRHGDPVHRYLVERGILLAFFPEDLRYHPGLPYWDVDANGKPVLLGKWPTMLAGVRNPQGEPVGLHRTYITSDGRKAPVSAPRKLVKVFDLSGAAVRLFEPRNGEIGLAEGLETAFSAYLLTGTPTWAALNAGGIERALLPEEIRRVTIFADRDPAGLKSAALACERFRREGREARILVPNEQKQDFNDILKNKNAQPAAN